MLDCHIEEVLQYEKIIKAVHLLNRKCIAFICYGLQNKEKSLFTVITEKCLQYLLTRYTMYDIVLRKGRCLDGGTVEAWTFRGLCADIAF